MFFPFTKTANKSQEKKLLSQCHLKDIDPLACSSLNPCKLNDVAHNSSEDSSRSVLSLSLFCQQGAAVEVCNCIFKALDCLDRQHSYVRKHFLCEKLVLTIKAVCLVFDCLRNSSPSQNNISIKLINTQIHFLHFHPFCCYPLKTCMCVCTV